MNNPSPIRLVVSDIDATFLAEDKTIPARNLEAVKSLQGAGIGFSFATGRYWPSIRNWARDFGLTSPQILDNGAIVVDPQTEKVISRTTLPKEAFFHLYDLIQNKYGFIAVCSDGLQYHVSQISDELEYSCKIHQESLTLHSEEELLTLQPNIVKMTVYCPSRIQDMHKSFQEITDSAFGSLVQPTFTEAGIYVINAKPVSKMSGIELAARSFGCSTANVASIGDGDNDQPMLSGCQCSFAMANATPLAKKAARFITEHDCNQAGFAEAVEKILEFNQSL